MRDYDDISKEALFGIGDKKSKPDQQVKTVIDPIVFDNYIKDKISEPIEVVRKRFYQAKPLDVLDKYFESGEFNRDYNRLFFETGEIEDRSQGGFLFKRTPEKARALLGEKAIRTFYEEVMKGKKPMPAELKALPEKVAVCEAINRVANDLNDNVKYLSALDKVACSLGFSVIAMGKTATLSLQEVPGGVDQVTTKEDKTLSELMVDPALSDIKKFMEAVEKMSKADPKDTDKDRKIKGVYIFFLKNLVRPGTDTAKEMKKLVELADKQIGTFKKYQRRYDIQEKK